FDVTRSLARLRFENVELEAVGAPGQDGGAIERGLEEARVLACAEMVGGMQRVLEAAVDYANARHQFGRPIGSFQAIKHKCADMLIDFEGARTAVEAAIEACEGDAAGAHADGSSGGSSSGTSEGASERALLVAVAKAQTGPAYVRMAIENMQIQGGVGYTWEYDAHLYYRRAQASEIFHGPASDHHDRIARLLAGAAGPAAKRSGGHASSARGHAA
ncbi:hypothetical protein K2X89_03295, partial [Myxococcota bacterium]|nr:hypothetical protein [Myxococcota bacterium]